MGLGLRRGTVRLEEYDPLWHDEYTKESTELRSALNLEQNSIEHIGSTSIPGMTAKPIIDIAIHVNDLNIAEDWKTKLEKIGYWYKDTQSEMPNRRFFAKGPESNRTVYLHIVNKNEFDRLVNFRNFLINNHSVAKEYADLKIQLAPANMSNRKNYSSLKNEFIQNIISQLE